jgi:hypothetical protein
MAVDKRSVGGKRLICPPLQVATPVALVNYVQSFICKLLKLPELNVLWWNMDVCSISSLSF